MNDDLSPANTMTGQPAAAEIAGVALSVLVKASINDTKPGDVFVEIGRNECQISCVDNRGVVGKNLYNINLYVLEKRYFYVV